LPRGGFHTPLRHLWLRHVWERASPRPERKIGVNARNFDPQTVLSIRVIALDRAAWWCRYSAAAAMPSAITSVMA
jgi:hypothetical protein